jgi:hypothetical protein
MISQPMIKTRDLTKHPLKLGILGCGGLTSRSMPMPTSPVGGIPWQIARRNRIPNPEALDFRVASGYLF